MKAQEISDVNLHAIAMARGELDAARAPFALLVVSEEEQFVFFRAFETEKEWLERVREAFEGGASDAFNAKLTSSLSARMPGYTLTAIVHSATTANHMIAAVPFTNKLPANA
jgi:hypothetical protein